MHLNYHEQKTIMDEFPIIELSYEKKIYKKVSHSDLYVIIPKGEKHFAWFRQYKNHPVCILLHLESRKKIKNIKIYMSCFKEELCVGKGSIVYGTLFTLKGNLFFSIEDIFYFMDTNIAQFNHFQKISNIARILNEYLKQVPKIKNNIIFGLPIMMSNYQQAVAMINEIVYTPYCLQHRMVYKKRPFLNEFIEPKKYAIFNVRSAVQTDIYYLYCYGEDGAMKRHDICNIPDFTTSKMMNNLFRDIKENDNLDALEESDDEGEFEDINPAKYVHLDRVYKMLCVYNKKFRRWRPIKIGDERDITNQKKIFQIEKK